MATAVTTSAPVPALSVPVAEPMTVWTATRTLCGTMAAAVSVAKGSQEPSAKPSPPATTSQRSTPHMMPTLDTTLTHGARELTTTSTDTSMEEPEARLATDTATAIA